MNQLSLPLARATGELAAQRCADKAARVSDFDREGAARFIRGWLVRHGPASGEVLTDAAKLHGFRPHDERAMGAVFAGLARRKQIRCVGFCMRKKGHGTAGGRVWAAV